MSIKERLEKMLDLRMVMHRLGIEDANLELFKQGIIDSQNTALLESLEEEWAAYSSEAAAQDAISTIHESMSADVADIVSTMFGTSKETAALRIYLTTLDMQSSPASYVNRGIMTLYPVMDGKIELLPAGTLLLNEAMVTQYAEFGISQFREAGIQLWLRVQQYQQELMNIKGG